MLLSMFICFMDIFFYKYEPETIYYETLIWDTCTT